MCLSAVRCKAPCRHGSCGACQEKLNPRFRFARLALESLAARCAPLARRGRARGDRHARARRASAHARVLIAGGPDHLIGMRASSCYLLLAQLIATNAAATFVEDEPSTARHCPGNPVECSGHGKCIGAQCHCADGFFGHDCRHRNRECTKLQSCSDCQNPANQKYCGWCGAGDRYCVPKHVYKALDRKGKACAAWHEDTCPRNTSSTTERDELLMEWGDDRSVALAEALVAMIDEAGGKGASSLFGAMLLLCGIVCIGVCTLREKRAEERRRRYEAFMADESESLKSATPRAGASARGAGRFPGSPWGLATAQSRRLGPAPPAPHATAAADGHARALADAIGHGAPGGCSASQQAYSSARPTGGGDLSALAAAERAEKDATADAAAAAKMEAAEAEALRKAMREAARRDIEERKERRRALNEETRQSALRVERAAAEEQARAELQLRTKMASVQSGKGLASPPAAAPAPAAPTDAAAMDAPAAARASVESTALNRRVGSRDPSSLSPTTAAPDAAAPPGGKGQAETEPGGKGQAETSSQTNSLPPSNRCASVPACEPSARTAAATPDSKLEAAEAEFLAALDDFE